MARRPTTRTGPARSWGRSGPRALIRHPAADDGFTIIESTVALVLIFGVILGLLHTVVTASKGIVTARQRNVAVGLANQILEQARATSYALVGLNSADPTLASDARIVSGQYDGLPLAYASPGASSPWSPHQFSELINGTTYTTFVYVTTVTPATGAGEPYKRVTALVDWTGSTSQFAASSGIKSQVKLESYLYDAELPADPLLQGLTTVSGGFFTVSGTIDNLSVSDATFTLPKASSDLMSQLVKKASSAAQSASADLRGNLELYALGAGVSSGLTASIPSVKVSSTADNDAGTSATDSQESSGSDSSGEIGRVNTLSMPREAGTSLFAKSTVKSTSTALGDADNLPYTTSEAAGPASFTMPYAVSGILGSSPIGSLLSTGASRVNTVIDRDDAGANTTIIGTTTVSHPARTVLSLVSSGLTIVTASGLPYSGMVRIGATGDVVATAAAGAAAANPSITGGSFEVCLFDTVSPPLLTQGTCPAGYERLVVVPGSVGSLSTSASLLINDISASMTTTVTSGSKSVPTPTMSGSDIERAEASLQNWLRVTSTLTISGGTSLTMELTYGSIEARAKYCLPTDTSCIEAAL
jgi:type II secretory pathway pseudopilin PulG